MAYISFHTSIQIMQEMNQEREQVVGHSKYGKNGTRVLVDWASSVRHLLHEVLQKLKQLQPLERFFTGVFIIAIF